MPVESSRRGKRYARFRIRVSQRRGGDWAVLRGGEEEEEAVIKSRDCLARYHHRVRHAHSSE